MRQVVITGIGVVSPMGCDLQRFWERAKSGYSAGRAIQGFDASKFDSRVAAEVFEFDADAFLSKKEQRRTDLFCQYAMAATKMAIADSGIDTAAEAMDRIGVVVGSGIGGLHTLQEQHAILMQRGPGRCSPFMIPQMIINMASGLIAIQHGFKGPNYAIVSACATGLHSIGDSLRIIQRGDADVMISGGTEATVCELAVGGFAAMKALTTRNDAPEKASRPFDRDRDGFLIGEGAAIVVMEDLERARRRGAKIYCEVAGFGMTCDAFHMTAPDDNGTGAAQAMRLAMKDAGLTPEQIDYVNAHGTSTPLNDRIETIAIKSALGEARARQIMVSSSKSMHGHMLGAAGAVESVICALSLRDGVVTPTINYETPDPDCDLDYVPNTAREVKIGACLNNSLGFGGHNACVAFKAV